MKTGLFFIVLLVVSVSGYTQGTDPLIVIQSGEEKKLYKGVANEIFIEVIDQENVCNSSHTVFLNASNAEVSKKGKHFYILPKGELCVVKVYVDNNNAITEVGSLEYKTVVPDTTDGIFRMTIPKIITKIVNDVNFDPEGKSIKQNSEKKYMIRVPNIPVIFLYGGIVNNLNVYLANTCTKSPEIIIESREAKVLAIPGKPEFYSITPKVGTKKCTLDIYTNVKGKKKLADTRVYNVRLK